MPTVRRELVRLWRCVIDRPKWELVLAMVTSTWTMAWIVGQAHPSRPSPLDLIADVMTWAGIPIDWLTATSAWFDRDARHGVLIGVAVVAGLLWAATTERAQRPALAGWLAVLFAAEGLGYYPAVYLAVLTMIGFVVLLALLALPGKTPFAIDRIVLVPRDVVRAGATAAALAAMVPLLTPIMLLTRLLRPYVTRPPTRVERSPLAPALSAPRVPSSVKRESAGGSGR
jgi:hypothetical protein